MRRLVLNRPHRRNALDTALVKALRQAVEEALDDPAVHVIIIAGAGPSFCAGADLRHLFRTRDNGGPLEFLTEVSECFTFIAGASKPLVDALHGHVVAGGLELALACDVLVAEEGTVIGDGHVAMGLLPAAGSSVRLFRRVPEPLARWMLLTGELLPVEQLHLAGLVHRVVPAGTLDAAVADACQRLRQPSLAAQRATKGLLLEQTDLTTGNAAPLRAEGLRPASAGRRPPRVRRLRRPRRRRIGDRAHGRWRVNRYDEQVVIVTGAAQGLGLAMSRRFHAEGAHVTACDTNADALQQLETKGIQLEVLDVTCSRAVEELVPRILAQHGRVDVAVSNAGIIRDDRVERMTGAPLPNSRCPRCPDRQDGRLSVFYDARPRQH